MTNVAVPFSYIPADILVPGFFFEVRALDNTGLLQFQSLLIGQVLPTGSLGPTVIATDDDTGKGDTLIFASLPANIVVGMYVANNSAPSSIAAGTTVLAISGNNVQLSANVSSIVTEGDDIQFTAPEAHGPVLVSTVKQAKGLFGPGSMLANQVAAYRAIDSFGTLYCLPLFDDPTTTKASGQINIAGTVSATSTLYLYVAGVRIPVRLTSTMSNDDIAVAVVAAINAKTDLPVVATGSTFPITLTANNGGEVGNDIDIRVNYHGIRADEVTPAGLNVSITPMASGAVNPDLVTALATLGSTPFDVIAGPYNDDDSLDAIEEFLGDASGRWSYLQELFGHYFTASSRTVGNLITLGTGRNNQHVSILGLYKSPTPGYFLASALAANAAVSLRADPGVPLNTLQLTGCLAPAMADRFTIGDRQSLLAAGIATVRMDLADHVIIDRVVTTYTMNEFDQPDNSYQNVEKMFCIAYIVKYTGSILSGLYSRVKLAADGTRIPVGANIVTPAIVKGTLISIYGDLVDLGLAQNFDNFSKNVVCQINETNPNRLDVIMPVTPIYQLDVVAISLQLVI